MKKIIFTLFTVINITTFAQTKYFTRNGVISFISDAPMEKIHGDNKQVNVILNPQTNEVAYKVVMKSFLFEKQAMTDHFNNDYLETDKLPNATFTGKIVDKIDFTKNGTYDVTVEGKLTIHGVTHDVKQKGKLIIADGKMITKGTINILLSDYGVKVPNNYFKKINNNVVINIDATLTPYQR